MICGRISFGNQNGREERSAPSSDGQRASGSTVEGRRGFGKCFASVESMLASQKDVMASYEVPTKLLSARVKFDEV